MASSALPVFSGSDYGKFLLAGATCCLATHGAMTPIDVIKTRIQIDPSVKGQGMLAAGRTIVAKSGPSVLMTGFGPTAVGYLLQGGAKFAGYEYWKLKLIQAAGGPEAALPHRTAIYLTGAALAEFFADILLTPCEAVRIRLVSDSKYATGFFPAFARMAREGGIREFYAGFIPILCKQVPYALGQFTVNEWMHETVDKNLSEKTKASLGPVSNKVITLGCGVVAGAAAAILSQPADTLLSQINKGKGGSGGVVTKLVQLAKEAGPVGLFSGLGPRIVMTAGLVSGQFFLYQVVKDVVGAKPGVELHKVD